MDESEDNLSSEDLKTSDSPMTVKSKPKKRSLIERELETSLTSRVTSPGSIDGTSTSRYGRARRLKTEMEQSDTKKVSSELKSPLSDKSPMKTQSPVYKMHASNSPLRTESPKKIGVETFLDNQIESIYQENISLSRFGSEEIKAASPSPAKKFPKVYIRKDLIQKRESDESASFIKMFSPAKSTHKSSNTHLNNILERSTEQYSSNSAKQNGFLDNSSVVKTLDFDSKKKKKENKDVKIVLSKSDLFELEAKCAYQVGDLAWARMGTYPFWPSIVTRDPSHGIFVKKKLFGRIERDIIHVTFFGDNGRRGWIVDTMLRRYFGQLEFENTRENFTPEDKKKDPRLYAAFFVSEKKQALWNTSVEEAEMLLREPKRLRIDIFNDMLEKSRLRAKQQKSGKISRTDSDVSLSESLYDSLFSEDDGKTDNTERARNRTRNKSLDVFEVVTACLDNMAAKTGITKIQRQSHMDRWLQKAKSKTPEKTQAKTLVPQVKLEEKKEPKLKISKKKSSSKVPINKPYSLRRSMTESQNLLPFQNEHDYSKQVHEVTDSDHNSTDTDSCKNFAAKVPSGIGVIAKIDFDNDKIQDKETKLDDDSSNIENSKKIATMNGISESTKNETIDKTSQDMSSVTSIATSSSSASGEDATRELKESFNVNQDLDAESQVNAQNIEINRGKTVSPLYEDSPSEDTQDCHINRELENTRQLRSKQDKKPENPLENAEFVIYLEMRQDAVIDENPNLSQEEITAYLYKTWLYEEGAKTDDKKNNDLRESNLVKGLNSEPVMKKKHQSKSKKQNKNKVVTPVFDNSFNEDTQKSQITTNDDKNIENDSLSTKIRDDIASPVYEDSYSQNIQESRSTANDESNTEDDNTNTKIDSESLPLNRRENIMNDSSTIASTDFTEDSYMSVDDIDDSDYKPDYSTESDMTEDNCSMNESSLCNNSVELDRQDDITTKNDQNVNTISVLALKQNGICDDIERNHRDSEFKEEAISKEQFISTTKNNKRNELMDVDISESVSQVLENGDLGKGKDSVKIKSSEVNNRLSVFHIIREDIGIIEDKNVDTNKVPINCASDKTLHQDIIKSINKNGPINGHINVKEVDINTVKEVQIPMSLPEPIKENGVHDPDNNIPSDIDLDRISVHSEDSVTSTKSEGRRKLRSKQEQKQENPLENVEFVKYLEMRQDAIMDESPDLTQEEIVAYLYKTWLYEENSKSEDKKNDDLRELNLVKGLNLESVVKNKHPEQGQIKTKNQTKKSLSLTKNSMQKFIHRKRREDRKLSYIEVNDTPPKNEQTSIISDKIPENNTETSEKYRKDYDKGQNNETEIVLESTRPNIIETVISIEGEKQNDLEMVSTSKKIETISADTKHHNDERTQQNEVEVSLSDKDLVQIETNEEISPIDPSNAVKITFPQEPERTKFNDDFDRDSIDSEDSEAPLIRCKLRSKARKENGFKEESVVNKVKEEDMDTLSINSEDSEISITRRKKRAPKKPDNALEDSEFVKYLELRQDALIEENPQLTQDEIIAYLYQTWLYEENSKSEIKKSDEIEQSTLVKGLNDVVQQPKKIKRKIKTEKEIDDDVVPKEKPKRKIIKPYYNEEYSDIEEELEVFSIFKPKYKPPKVGTGEPGEEVVDIEEINDIDEVELYFEELVKPKPNVFKGLIREKVCEICEKTGHLVKCKGCSGMFHADCVSKEEVKVEVPTPSRGRKKKKRPGRKPRNPDDPDNHDDKSQDVSEENNASIEEIIESESHTVDAETLEAQIEAKMKEILEKSDKMDYDSYSSDDGLDWTETVPGKCEIIDIKLKPRTSNAEIDYSNFKCKNCQKYDTPICFVCKSAVSKNEAIRRQKCHVAHCHKYYHLECLDHWPQTQFNGGEPSKTNKKISEYFEALTCPRHVCHTCVSDDPRGCKTRFSGDKLAKCVRCPATYHSFTKCLPAGTQILTASHIICPRHYEHRPGKVPCHVNTGWCFICALGGSLICCEYCPTSFHAECLNIKPPEGGYMCEDCETGRLPLYGEMVWVKLGHYRWWPGIILHPSEIPENILAVKHNLGEFVVRFFGQYDHYWVNRGRVFPFQEGDSGRISSQKSKIDAAFTTAMEHAQRACEILKSAQPNEEESLDIASSLLPPHYVKLKVNKPCGSLCGRRLEDPESSLTQCECNPNDEDPCGPYSQCLNRMLLTECGPTCRAGDRCNNRAFEKRLYPKLVPYRTPSRGWGLKTLEDIKAGQFVIEYVGELIDEEEFRRRMRRKHEIRDENFYFLTLDKERMIDAGPKGNLARFMNHCCEPNCETQKWTVLGDVRVGLFALYDIPANSEVTFNYNLECAGIEKKRCMCGAKRCSGYIGAKPKQDESQSKKSKIPGKRTYKKRKTTEESPSTKNKPKRPIGRPPKPRELTEIEKDLLIIRNATNGLSSDESSRSMSSEYERNPKALKRKRVSFSTEEIILYDGSESPSVKKHKLDDKSDVGD